MQLSNFFNRNRIRLLILALILLVIPIVTVSIFYLDRSENKSSVNLSQEAQDTATLKQKIGSILGEDVSSTKTEGSRIIQKFETLENPKSSQEDKYKALALIASFTQSLYSDTHNPKLYSFINNDLVNYAKKYFSEFYKEAYFVYSCQDPSCAQNSQPKEILAVIEEIKTSDFPPQVKQTLSEDLLNAGYRSKAETPGKVSQYMLLAQMIKNNKNFSPTGQNLKIAQEIENYVKNTFPKEYEKIRTQQ